MSNLKTLTILTTVAFLTVPAVAQDAGSDTIFKAANDTVASDFTSADLDQNGSLNADEFVTFAVMRAEDGEESFKDIVIGGEYTVAFTAHDKDASGSLEPAELHLHRDQEDVLEKITLEEEKNTPPENDQTITPDN